jgi:gliding motility-associated-like protein
LELDFSFDRVSCGSNSNTISFFGDIKTQDNLRTIQWAFGDGATINNIVNPIHQYTTSGDFQVFLLVTTALGCSKVINKPLRITSISPIAMVDSVEICVGDSIMLPLISDGDKQYVWSPSSTLNNPSIRNPTAKPTETTTYKVIVLNILEDGDTCFQTDSIKVKVLTDFGVSYTLTSDKNPVEPDELFQLSVLPNQFNYSWKPSSLLSNPSISNPTARISEDTWFTVTLRNQKGCFTEDSILIEVLEVEDPCKTKDVFIPNAFSPDGNGFNDVLFVRNVEADEFLFVLYNRWGIKVFESRDSNFGWDGRFNGVLQSTDVFGYYLRLVCNGEVTERKGNVTLVR